MLSYSREAWSSCGGIELRCTQDGHVFRATISPKQHVNHNSPGQKCLNTVVGELTVLGLSHVPREISHISRQVVLLATFLFIYLSPFQYLCILFYSQQMILTISLIGGVFLVTEVRKRKNSSWGYNNS